MARASGHYRWTPMGKSLRQAESDIRSRSRQIATALRAAGYACTDESLDAFVKAVTGQPRTACRSKPAGANPRHLALAEEIWQLAALVRRDHAPSALAVENWPPACIAHALPLVGPLRADGRPATGARGSLWVFLVVDTRCVGFWFGTSWSRSCVSSWRLHSATDLLQMPAGLLRALHRTLLRWPVREAGS
jgi:hypothetical protein